MIVTCLTSGWLLASLGAASALPDPPAITRPIAAIESDLRRLQSEHPDHLRVVEIGRTASGRGIHAAIAANFQDETWKRRPGVLAISGIDGHHAVGGELVLHHLRSVLEDEKAADLLAHRTLYFVPRLNVDGIEARFQDPPLYVVGNLRPRDEDRDRRSDEDGPDDLDGNGVITWLRKAAPEGPFVPFGERGLMRRADPARGETGRYTYRLEGRDEDGDGRTNEDPRGDVSLDRNFPHAHPEHSGIGGLYPASEPETRAIIDFLLQHRNILTVLVYGAHDNLREKPKRTGRRSETIADENEGRSSFRRSRGAPQSWLPADLEALEGIGASYREHTGLDTAVSAPAGGTFGEWAYYQFGALVALARPFSPLDGMEWDAEEKKLDEETKLELARLRHAERLGHGFHAWQPFEHEELGSVEIGGFEEGFLLEPDRATWEALVPGHDAFHRALVARGPEVTIEEPVVRERANGVFEIEIHLRNDGTLATASAMSQRARMRRPPRVRLELDGCELVAGREITLASHLEAFGGRQGFRWIVVRKMEGASATLHVDSDILLLERRILLP